MFNMKFIMNSIRTDSTKEMIEPTNIRILVVLFEKLVFLKISVSIMTSIVNKILLLI
jgi:hypothetical protein